MTLKNKKLRWFIAGMLMDFILVIGGSFLYIISTEQGYQTTRCVILSNEHEVEWEWCVWAMSDLENPENINYSADRVDF